MRKDNSVDHLLSETFRKDLPGIKPIHSDFFRTVNFDSSLRRSR